MSYSVIFEQAKANKEGLRKVYVLVTIDGEKMPRIDTNVKVPSLKNLPKLQETILSKKRNEIENIILDVIYRRGKPVKEEIRMMLDGNGGTGSLSLFWDVLRKSLKGIVSEARLKSIGSAIGHWDAFRPSIKLCDVDETMLNAYRQYLITLKLAVNTVWKYLNCTQTVLNHAVKKKMITSEQFDSYQWPEYVESVATFLTEEEIASFHEQTKNIRLESIKTSGYYFLLSCYAGYRISDSRGFKYEDMVHGDFVALRADKNGKIVSIPIHSRLRNVLDYIKDHEGPKVEQQMRRDVKEIAKLAGITKHVKFHTARHSFAMMLTKNDFSEGEVARFIGDDIRTAKRYAKLWDSNLHKKIIDKLG